MRPLTRHEQAVLVDLINGHTQKEIARRLGLALATVKYHMTRLRSRTGSRTLAQLAARAVADGLVEPSAGAPVRPPEGRPASMNMSQSAV
jgi:DNA-binding NarL/FixJ family response regulator